MDAPEDTTLRLIALLCPTLSPLWRCRTGLPASHCSFFQTVLLQNMAGAMHHCFPGSFKEPNDHVARRNRPRFIHMQRKGKELCRPANCQSSLTHPDWRARPQPPVKLTWPSRDPSSRARWASPPPQWGQSCRPSARPTRSNPKASSKEMRAYKGRINSKECLRQRGRKRQAHTPLSHRAARPEPTPARSAPANVRGQASCIATLASSSPSPNASAQHGSSSFCPLSPMFLLFASP